MNSGGSRLRGFAGSRFPDLAEPASPRSRATIHTALFTVSLLFSLNYIISKVGMRAFSPLSFAYLRVLGSALLLNVLPGAWRPLPNKDVTLLACLGVVTNQALFLAGLYYTSAHIAAILITTIPVFTLGIAILAGRESATALKIGGIALAGFGALLVVWGEGIEGSLRSLIGALMIVGNSMSYSFYLVLSKPVMALHSSRVVLARMFAVACVIMLPLCCWSLAHEHYGTVPSSAWWSLAAVIAGPTVLAYVINGWSLRYADSSLVATYVYVQPVLTTFLAAFILGEEIRRIAIVAAALIFTGVWLSQWSAPPPDRAERVEGPTPPPA